MDKTPLGEACSLWELSGYTYHSKVDAHDRKQSLKSNMRVCRMALWVSKLSLSPTHPILQIIRQDPVRHDVCMQMPLAMRKYAKGLHAGRESTVCK